MVICVAFALSDQLQEAKNLLVKQTEKSDKNLNAAECRINDINNDLESKTEECERLQAELDEVRYDVDILMHVSLYNLQHMICVPISLFFHLQYSRPRGESCSFPMLNPLHPK